jgi:hypothetical protein
MIYWKRNPGWFVAFYLVPNHPYSPSACKCRLSLLHRKKKHARSETRKSAVIAVEKGRVGAKNDTSHMFPQ